MVYYDLKGKHEKAFEYSRQVAVQHPDYLFSKVNLASEYIFNRALAKVPEVLGTGLDLQELYPQRKVFHLVEYTSFYKVVVKYWCATGETDKAITILYNLEALEGETDKDFNLKELETDLLMAGADRMVRSLKEEENEVAFRTEPTLPQTTEAPTFHHPQIQWLYENSFHIDEDKIAEILLLERDTVIKDLDKVVYDAIKRFDFFYEKDYKPATHDFVLHALYLLKELEAEESLPVILEFLRQPEKVLEFWMGDLITENMWQVIYAASKNQLPVLEDYLKEPLNYTFARSEVAEAISQLALHEPQRRAEVIAVYRRLLQFFKENKDNPEVFNFSLSSFLIGDIVDINGKELLHEVKEYYDLKLVDESMEGDWEYMREELATNDEKREFSRKRKLQNIYEIIEEVKSFETDVAEESGYDEKDKFTDYEEVKDDDVDVRFLNSGNQPYKREEKKIGRNEPCPCGSGLKYKKCHGKDS